MNLSLFICLRQVLIEKKLHDAAVVLAVTAIAGAARVTPLFGLLS